MLIVEALDSLHICTYSPKLFLLADAISTEVSYTGPYIYLMVPANSTGSCGMVDISDLITFR